MSNFFQGLKLHIFLLLSYNSLYSIVILSITNLQTKKVRDINFGHKYFSALSLEVKHGPVK